MACQSSQHALSFRKSHFPPAIPAWEQFCQAKCQNILEMAIVHRTVLPFLFAYSVQLLDEFVWKHGGVVEDEMYIAMCWTLGFVAIRRTDWLVRQALLIQRRYPRAFVSLLAERSWYPRILRGLGATLLFFGFIFTVKIILRILWVLNLNV